MINVSNEFRQLMNTRTDFKENAEITFANGEVLELTEKDFTISNNSIVDASASNGIPLGVAVCRSIKIELMNDDDRFSDYDFFGAKIRLYLTFQLSKTVERIEYGTFTVLTPETYGTTVIITALDDMYKADAPYETTLAFPSTIGLMLRDACTSLGISQGSVNFLNDDFEVNEMPEDITFRQLIGYIAMIAGGNARIDTTGRLRIITYDFALLEEVKNKIDGGMFKPWSNPINLDGGSYNPWSLGDVADGGLFTDSYNHHILSNWSTLKVDTDDVVITGIQTTYTDEENEEHTVMYGQEGYVLKVTNPLFVGKEQEVIDLIGNIMVGGRFRQFSGDLISNPTCEFMDLAVVSDRKGNIYYSFLTDINFKFFGFTSIKNSALSTIRNSAQAYSNATQTLVTARKLIKKERNAREQAVAKLAQDLKNSSGLFMTEDKQADGSIVYYMHDKPTLAESVIVWKLTALAFGISTDGGKTYPYGFTVNGELITKLLYAEGIDADYITSGSIDSLKVDVKNLVVGENVSMGPNAVISWEQVSGTNNVANTSDIPTKTSELTNDSNLAYLKDIPTDEYMTKITKDTVTSAFIKSLNLFVGNEIQMGSNAKISWGNVTEQPSIPTNTNQLTNGAGFTTMAAVEGKGYQNASQVTQITKNTVTTSYVNALKITAASVAAENITGTTIKGKKLEGATGDFTGKITAASGKIGGFTIGTSSLYTSSASSLGGIGVYVGTNGVSCASSGTSSILKSDGSAEFKTSNGVKVYYGSTNYTYIKSTGISIRNSTYTDTSYTEKAISCYSAFAVNGYNGLTFDVMSSGTRTLTLQAGSALKYAEFKTSTSYVYGGSNGISFGKSNGKIGFFGNDGSTKKTVSKLTSTSSATTSTIATKLNDLIDALQEYNLIG